MIQEIKETIKREKLIEVGDKVIVGISGGPDSVCLLHALHSIKEDLKIDLYAAHLNHNFRGIASQLDAHYVSQLCERLNILCFIKSEDVSEFAKKNSLSLEEAGRIKRYQFFEEVSEKVGVSSKIAVAHNLNDQAETVLMRFLRGTGTEGLTAIHFKRGKIIRPLLNVKRKEIEDYCFLHKLDPRIDGTNLEPIYHRNKIRIELIPYLKENYNPNIIETMARMAEILKHDSSFMEEQGKIAFNDAVLSEENNVIVLSVEKIKQKHAALKPRILRLATEKLMGRKEALEYKHIQSILNILEKGDTAKRLTLPLGISFRTSYDKLILSMGESDYDGEYAYELEPEGYKYISEIGQEIHIKVLEKEEKVAISRDKYLKYFDYDKVKNNLLIRNRKEGDRFWPLGLSGSKKLKDFFIDYKIDREKRKLIPLVCDGEEIMWVVGYRMSEKYKITDSTKRILAIEFKTIK
ncbi:tRNA lysidine(34) synthetase TilS [Serpentinicella sp. ANB-PHB4]|uniref:tRNA lysidine(34) synthetase TilS n=1 Tax=Serpentinicella sp. ANB-PHB4 TaxID=3074076 RepID=UPI00285B26F6|nr:tRNA lysidine(34) synthetase TilS [Serpentinicella sp. ANB-PHB4]MDR5659120.1 tRNA lysidine(34) synthetase TilS [Serpentinicella sp. ANB-PHB4]